VCDSKRPFWVIAAQCQNFFLLEEAEGKLDKVEVRLMQGCACLPIVRANIFPVRNYLQAKCSRAQGIQDDFRRASNSVSVGALLNPNVLVCHVLRALRSLSATRSKLFIVTSSKQVLTGSRLAVLWANLAVSPVNGYAIIGHLNTVVLSSRFDLEYIDFAWGRLSHKFDIPVSLRFLAPRHHVGLVYFCREWIINGRPKAVASFCADLLRYKVYLEVR